MKPDTSGSILLTRPRQRSNPHSGKVLQIKFPAPKAQNMVSLPGEKGVVEVSIWSAHKQSEIKLSGSLQTIHVMITGQKNVAFKIF